MKEPAYWPLNFLEYEIPEDLPRRADTKYGSMEEMIKDIVRFRNEWNCLRVKLTDEQLAALNLNWINKYIFELNVAEGNGLGLGIGLGLWSGFGQSIPPFWISSIISMQF